MKSKMQIASDWKKLTFTEMHNVQGRSHKELSSVLAFEKKLRK